MSDAETVEAASVTSINSESIEAFIARKRSVSTRQVAYRFGLEIREAKKALDELHDRGVLRKRLEEVSGECAPGVMCQWEPVSAV